MSEIIAPSGDPIDPMHAPRRERHNLLDSVAFWLHGMPWQHRIFTLMQLGVAVWVCVLWTHSTAPGWAIAVLGGVAAAMSLHGEMRAWQKSFWMILIACLLIVELKTISKDRAENEKKALEDRAEQDRRFRELRAAQDLEFAHTAQGLEDAIAGIQSTLRSANRTLRQTRPFAFVRFADGISILNSPQPPAMFSADTEYNFKCDLFNDGNDEAKVFRSLRRVYVGKPDDRKSQEQLVS